jgi:hypothetical protein
MAATLSGPKAAHKPTEMTRFAVLGASLAGHTQEQVAEMLGLNFKTLTKHYEEELTNSADVIIAEAAGTLVHIMRNSQDDKTRFQVAQFILRTKGRWRSADSIAKDRHAEAHEALVSQLAIRLVDTPE